MHRHHRGDARAARAPSANGAHQAIGDPGGNGQRQDPGPEDPFHDAEVEGFLHGWCRCDLVPEAGATTVSLLVGTEESSQGISVEEVRDYLVANLNAIEWPN